MTILEYYIHFFLKENEVFFKYGFASDEYPGYVNSNYNDAFGSSLLDHF